MAARKNAEAGAVARVETVSIPRIKQVTTTLYVVGTRPLICNRMAEKAKHELLIPRGRKTTADRASSLKHDPYDEFQASPYRLADPSAPTLLALMSSAFKGAMATAALDLPGAKKAQIGRLVWVEGDYTPVYGVPKLFMSVTRSADMNKTPDIRTRAIVPEWACEVRISFVDPLINGQGIFNLLYAAGLTVGVGDWRPEKGKGTYGQFRVLADQDDPELREIMRAGRAAQEEAMETPEPHDAETEELLGYWGGEVKRRGAASSQTSAAA